MGDEFVAEMNMWYGAKELASRWNGFPCFGQTIFSQTPLSFYQQPLSHLLEADIHAYIKAGKKDKYSVERFDWIRQNLKWYATISPSGYYEERRACSDPNCCGTRMLPLGPPQTPKPSTTNIRHYEELRAVEKLLDDESLATKLTSLNLFTEIPVNEVRYREMDYFLLSKALEVIFTNRRGFTEKDMLNFQVVFPCPREGLQEEIRKLSEKEKAKERRKIPISLRDESSPDKLHNETVTRLTETLREICNCGEEGCPWRTTGVKYDLASRIMEHSNECHIVVGKEIQTMARRAVENELRDLYSLPTSGTIKDLKERLARAQRQKWLSPNPSKGKDSQDTTTCNAGLTEDLLLLSSVINTLTDSSK